MSTHTYREVQVPVAGGLLHVGVWDPVDPVAADLLVIHGVTASHRAWPGVVEHLPGVRVIAPDLRGRGRSNGVTGDAGLAAHADDLAAVLDALGIDRLVVAGHSMGGFVGVVFAHRYPNRVARLLLIDGGLPLNVPQGMSADEVAAHVLGPTAARLSMRFGSVDDYLDFWRPHPAFASAWSAQIEEYFAYDLVDDGEGMLRPATTSQTMIEDTVDMNAGDALPLAWASLSVPVSLLTVPRGLQNEEPGLYPPDHLARVLASHPQVTHTRCGGFNHYTIVMSPEGARIVADAVREQLAAVGSTEQGAHT